jgi:hypothetical protein
MGKVSEQKKRTSGPAPGTETLQALEAKREVLLEELQRVEKRILQVRNAEPLPKSGCQAQAASSEVMSAASKPRVDRSKWSPKLRKLVEENWPEEGKEERIRRATAHPVPKLDTGELTPEQIKYFAEDVELEYDV